MNISPDEALDLLRKWCSERTPISVLLIFPDSDIAIKVSGFISGLSDDILISDESPNSPTRNQILIPARLTQSYDYVESKDLPIMPQYFAAKHGSANLRIALTNGASISFFESPTN
jgi:hypothetical protein